MWGGTGRCKIPRDGRGGGSGAGERSSDGRGVTRGKVSEVRGVWEATETMASVGSGRGRNTEDLPVVTLDYGAGGKYRVGGMDTEESAVNSAVWIG